MWSDFIAIALVQLAFLVVPGYLLLRAFGNQRLFSLVVSPIISSALICALCIVYSKCGISSSCLSVFVPISVVSGIACVAGLLIRRHGKIQYQGDSRVRWLVLMGYVAFGVLVGAFVFLSAIDDPNNFVQRFDNYMHLNAIRGFVETGSMTVFGVSPYVSAADAAISPYGIGGFYPAGWYILTALSLTVVPASVAVAENASLFVFVSVVFPAGVFLLLDRFREGGVKFHVYGAIASMAFIAFPWNLLEFGPIYPNAVGLALFPQAAVLFMELVEASSGLGKRIVDGCFFVLGIFSVAIIQTNVVFVLIIFLLPFLVSTLYRMGVPEGASVAESGLRKRNLLICVLLVLCVCALWCALYVTPMFQNMKAYGWVSSMSRSQALSNLMVLKTADAPPQVFLAIVVIAGFVYMYREKKHRWLLVSYAIMAVMTFLGESVDNVVKFVLDTFCYSDTRRLWAFLAVFGMPIATYGFMAIESFVRGLFTKNDAKRNVPWVPAMIILVFCVCNFAPQNALLGQSKPYNDPFDMVREMIAVAAVGEEVGLTDDERAFVDEVVETLPEGTLVMNMPTDGSMYVYGTEGLRVYYRVPSSYATAGESDDAKLLRLHLCEIANRSDVKEVVEKLGMDYLLLLDVGDDADSNWKTYGDDPELWSGMSSIDDDTPGFEVVLSEGDMRLYRIAA